MAYRWEVALPDTDAAGVVFTGRFIEHFARAEEAFMRARWLALEELVESHGIGMPAQAVECRFHAPLRLGDCADVRVSVRDLTRQGFVAAFTVLRVHDHVVCAEGGIRHRFVDLTSFRGIDLPEDLFLQLSAAVADGEAGG